jgi:hypothetical protein
MSQSDIALSECRLHFGYEAVCQGFLYALSLVRNVLDVNKHISNMSHKAKGLGRDLIFAETKKDRYRKRRKTTSSVSREKPEATIAHLLLN